MTFYIRTADGACFYVESFREALGILTGDNGYRLTIADEQGNELVIRCEDFAIEPELQQLECNDVTAVVRLK